MVLITCRWNSGGLTGNVQTAAERDVFACPGKRKPEEHLTLPSGEYGGDGSLGISVIILLYVNHPLFYAFVINAALTFIFLSHYCS